MKVASLETLFCDAGWRPWIFLKATADDGSVGWAEITDSHGSPHGLAGVVQDLAPLVVGRDPRAGERIYLGALPPHAPEPGSVIAKALGGIENALLDLKARALGVPVYELFGGPMHSRQRSSEYVVLRSRDVQLQLVHYLSGQGGRKLFAQHRKDNLVSGEENVFDSFLLDNSFELLNDFLAVAKMKVLDRSLRSDLPPPFELRFTSDLFTPYHFGAKGAREAKNEDACCICIRHDCGIARILVLELGQCIQMGLMINVEAVRVNGGIELERFEEVASSRAGEDGYTVRKRPELSLKP